VRQGRFWKEESELKARGRDLMVRIELIGEGGRRRGW